MYVLYLETVQKLEEEKVRLGAEVSELKKDKNDADALKIGITTSLHIL